jgi:hydrogenase maturation factor
MIPEDFACTTCQDEAITVRVLKVAGTTALVEDEQGQRQEVVTELIAGVSIHDVLLVHAGVALARLDHVIS